MYFKISYIINYNIKNIFFQPETIVPFFASKNRVQYEIE